MTPTDNLGGMYSFTKVISECLILIKGANVHKITEKIPSHITEKCRKKLHWKINMEMNEIQILVLFNNSMSQNIWVEHT